MINITAGHNESLQKKCKSLYDYCSFVNRVKENLNKGLKLNSAVNEAVEYAVRNNFLEGFFKEHKMKLSLLTEFNREAYDRHRRAEGFEEGLSHGARENSIASARNLLRMNLLTAEQISQAVSLPLEQVLALQEELTREEAREPAAQS